MSSLLNIGVQALTANQAALANTGQNIANVNTEGYSRQRVNFETPEPPLLGVGIQDIQRITDQFLVQQVWRDQSALSSSEQQAKKVQLLDKLMVSESTSLSTSIDKYFSALQRTVDDPLFIANRQLFLAEAGSLVSSFQNFDQRLVEQQNAISVEARSMVTSVNTIAANIANLNVKISSLASSGQNYNPLIDERDRLIKDLSSLVSVDVLTSNGGITNNVTLAGGEPLVSSGRSAQLAVRDGSPDPLQIKVVLTRGNVEADATQLLGTGALGGLFTYRDEVLQPVRNEVGRIAMVFAESMNEQHRKGMDLDGLMGTDLFNEVLRGQVYGEATNKTQGTNAVVTFYDVGALTGSDYEVEITGPDTFRVKRLSDGEMFESSNMSPLSSDSEVGSSGSFSRETSGTSNVLAVSLDGFNFILKSSEIPQRGDKFLLQPTKNGTRDMSLAIKNPESLALASILRVTPAPSNSGKAELRSLDILDASNLSALRPGQLDMPIEIVFNAISQDAQGNPVQTLSVFDISDPANPALIEGMESILYKSGEPIVMKSGTTDLYQLTFVNQPNAGDRFEVEYNTGGVSDNSNALAMANLQSKATANGYSYQDAYGQLLAKVGSQANSIQVSFMANQTVLTATEDALESVRGVNLDEEATKLIQYQQAYTASTRLITAYQDLFDSLIAAVR